MIRSGNKTLKKTLVPTTIIKLNDMQWYGGHNQLKNNPFRTKSWMRSEMIWKHIEQWQNKLIIDCLLAFCHLGTKTSWRKSTCFHPNNTIFQTPWVLNQLLNTQFTIQNLCDETDENKQEQNTMNNWLAKKKYLHLNKNHSNQVTKWPRIITKAIPQWAPWPHW